MATKMLMPPIVKFILGMSMKELLDLEKLKVPDLEELAEVPPEYRPQVTKCYARDYIMIHAINRLNVATRVTLGLVIFTILTLIASGVIGISKMAENISKLF